MRTWAQMVTNFTGADPNYPDGKAIDDAVPGDNTGTELVETWVNDAFGAMFATIRAAGLTPDGNAEYPGQSQFVDAIKLLSVPVGATLMWWDFNGLLSLPFGFLYANGQVVNDADSPIDGETLQDMSNRIAVGFGTEGGGDIGSAAWATGAVGNANHQVNLQHNHLGGLHPHAVGTLQFRIAYTDGLGDLYFYNSVGTGIKIADRTLAGVALPGGPDPWTEATFDQIGYTSNGTGSTANGGNVATDNQLSTTQSIQMRSIRVRYITKIK